MTLPRTPSLQGKGTPLLQSPVPRSLGRLDVGAPAPHFYEPLQILSAYGPGVSCILSKPIRSSSHALAVSVSVIISGNMH